MLYKAFAHDTRRSTRLFYSFPYSNGLQNRPEQWDVIYMKPYECRSITQKMEKRPTGSQKVGKNRSFQKPKFSSANMAQLGMYSLLDCYVFNMILP